MKNVIKIHLSNLSTYENLQKVVDLKKMYSKKDWLNNKKEKGQTFMEFIRSKSRNRVTKSKNVIYIMCMDDDIPEDALEKLQMYCSAFFEGLTVKIMEEKIDVPSNVDQLGITSRIRKDTKKIQYLATDLLDLLMNEHLPDDAYCVIGIINKDLYPKPNWTFVFGCSRIRKRTGIFSFARYDPNFEISVLNSSSSQRESINEKDEETRKLIIHRACKTMTHEIVHMFGVRHCIVNECLMNGTNRMQEGDLKPFLLCPVCLRKLHYAIGFDIAKRYHNLRNVLSSEFSENHHFTDHLKNLEHIISNSIGNVSDAEIEKDYRKFFDKIDHKETSNSEIESQFDESSEKMIQLQDESIEANNMVISKTSKHKRPDFQPKGHSSLKGILSCCCKCTMFRSTKKDNIRMKR
ncbi:unnamed protein product [Moneuplotes crassus]|uniref:Archaemetzincin-2 n=1 Tax=Euplotes crassus TaxID=5936 RepID=A0AAD1X676_EUPCR|nr:unnamed protein product [Moneuplotes crassus]